MAKRLFVGNLPYTIDDAGLSKLFAEVGEVISATVVKDKYSGRSRGFAFVEMEDEAAAKAIETLNGKDIEDRKIIVNEARPREERPGDRGPRE